EDLLVAAGLAGQLDEPREQELAHALAAMAAGDVDREIGDVAIGVARAERVEAAPGDDAATVLGDHDGVARAAPLEPARALLRRAQLRLERGQPVLDALVSDLADGRRVGLDGWPDTGRAHERARAGDERGHGATIIAGVFRANGSSGKRGRRSRRRSSP